MPTVKRLLWYQPGLHEVGGGERVLLEGLKYFTALGIKSVLFVEDKQISKEALFNGQYDPEILHVELPNHDYLAASKNIVQKIRYFFLLQSSLRDFNPDVIIANSQSEAKRVWFLTFCLFKKRVPVVCFIHGTFFQFADDSNKYAWIYRNNFAAIREADPVYKELISVKPPPMPLLSRIVLEVDQFLRFCAVRRTSAVFVLTEKTKKEVELLYGHPNVHVFHGAFPEKLFNATLHQNKKVELGINNRSVFLSLCRLIDKKRVDIIIKAFGLFVQKNPNSVLMIGGTGPERENLERLTTELQIEDKVRFLGFIREDELNDYYFSSDVFISADNADYDITSIVALALGRRVVSSSQHEFDIEVSKLNLLFQAYPSPQGFAQSFSEALAESRACDSALREKVMKGYSWEKYFENILIELTKHIN